MLLVRLFAATPPPRTHPHKRSWWYGEQFYRRTVTMLRSIWILDVLCTPVSKIRYAHARTKNTRAQLVMLWTESMISMSLINSMCDAVKVYCHLSVTRSVSKHTSTGRHFNSRCEERVSWHEMTEFRIRTLQCPISTTETSSRQAPGVSSVSRASSRQVRDNSRQNVSRLSRGSLCSGLWPYKYWHV